MTSSAKGDRAAFLALAMTAALGGAGCAQGLPPGVYVGAPDYHAATAGTYSLDPDHAGVIARVSHIGYAYSVFRFDAVKGALTWDPAAPERSSVSVTVQTASIATNVKGFAKELSGDSYLKSAAFPEATFVSTAFHQIDPLHGRVDGTFTLMGKTVPLSVDVTLSGAGKGFFGHPRLGVHGETAINPQDFGLPAMFSKPIPLELDLEFAKD